MPNSFFNNLQVGFGSSFGSLHTLTMSSIDIYALFFMFLIVTVGHIPFVSDIDFSST